MVARRAKGEGSIGRKRADGRYLVRLQVDGRTVSGYARTQREARELLRSLQRNAGLETEGDGTVAAFGVRWLRWCKDNRAPKTYAFYEGCWRLRIEPHLGGRELVELSAVDVLDWMAALEDEGTHSADAVRKAWETLSAAMGRAVRWGMVSENVVRRTDPPKHRARPGRFMELDQALAFLECARSHSHYPLMLTVALLGLRLGEALGLEWDHVDLGGGLLRTVRQPQRVDGAWILRELKTPTAEGPQPRAVPAPLVTVLRGQREAQQFARRAAAEFWEDWGLVFPSPRGRPIDHKTAEEHFYAICRAAKLPAGRDGGFTPHSLRHTCGSLLAELGVEPRVIMDVLRHSNLSMTVHYTRTAGAAQRRAVDRLAASLGLAANDE